MIEIEKFSDIVKIHLPIQTIHLNREQFDELSNEIYLLRYLSLDDNGIIREKGTIEELNMGHWLCIKNRYQTKFNDSNLKSLDVHHLIKLGII